MFYHNIEAKVMVVKGQMFKWNIVCIDVATQVENIVGRVPHIFSKLFFWEGGGEKGNWEMESFYFVSCFKSTLKKHAVVKKTYLF
jgi:hypothetical protein